LKADVENKCLLALVIANWNGREKLETCLKALSMQSFQDFRIFLVDNGSHDGSAAFVRENFPEVKLITLDSNHGFADPNNRAIRLALEDPNVHSILTLNNDTSVAPDFLEELIACAERHPEASVIQPKIINYYEQDVLDSTGMLIARGMSAVNRGLGEKDTGQFDQEEEIFGAAASAALFKRDALEKVALRNDDGSSDYFDSDYFAYHEDVDLAWRLRLAGYKAVYTPKAKVLHVHSMTGGSASPFKAHQVHRNHYFNLNKNVPGRFLLRALVQMVGVYWASLVEVKQGQGAAAQLKESARENSQSMVSIVLRGWIDVLRNLPRMWRKRKQVQAIRTVTNQDIESWLSRFGDNAS